VNVQASGELGRVDLLFNPVDEPDLAGYNIYRSDVSGGPYTKVNPAVITRPITVTTRRRPVSWNTMWSRQCAATSASRTIRRRPRPRPWMGRRR